MHKLVIFDVDGTLTATSKMDTDCYVRAMSEHLGIVVESNWSAYRHVTDSGIARELFAKHGRALSEMALVRDRFISLVGQALADAPGCCEAVAGAADFLGRLRRVPGIAVGIATGGWSGSARLKLGHAGIDITGLAFASADDAESRVGIMRACWDRVAAGSVAVGETIYVGDGVWDVGAARELGWRFIGIGKGPRAELLLEAGARCIFEDYLDMEAVLKAVSG